MFTDLKTVILFFRDILCVMKYSYQKQENVINSNSKERCSLKKQTRWYEVGLDVLARMALSARIDSNPRSRNSKSACVVSWIFFRHLYSTAYMACVSQRLWMFADIRIVNVKRICISVYIIHDLRVSFHLNVALDYTYYCFNGLNCIFHICIGLGHL